MTDVAPLPAFKSTDEIANKYSALLALVTREIDRPKRSVSVKLYGTIHHGRYFIASTLHDGGPRIYQVWHVNAVQQVHPAYCHHRELNRHVTYTAARKWLDRNIANGWLTSYGPASSDKES